VWGVGGCGGVATVSDDCQLSVLVMGRVEPSNVPWPHMPHPGLNSASASQVPPSTSRKVRVNVNKYIILRPKVLFYEAHRRVK
jgi:hypothetical protein